MQFSKNKTSGSIWPFSCGQDLIYQLSSGSDRDFKLGSSASQTCILKSMCTLHQLFPQKRDLWNIVLICFICIFVLEHDTAEEVTVKVFLCQNSNLTIITSLTFTYISQMEHTIAKFLAQSASDPEVAEKLDAIWTICLGKDHQELWDKRLAQAFVQLELPIEWSLVGDILQKGTNHDKCIRNYSKTFAIEYIIKFSIHSTVTNIYSNTYS